MRKFALSSSAFRRLKLTQAIRHVALAGYTGVEIVADAPHGYPPALTRADRQAVLTALSQNRVALAHIDASPMTALRDEVRPCWIEADKVLRNERLQHTLDAAKLGKDLNCPTLSTLAGGELEPNAGRADALARFAAGLKDAADSAHKRKYPAILIDPKPGLLVANTDQAVELLTLTGRSIGINLNTGHLHLAGDDLPTAIHTLKDFIRHVHIEDIQRDGSAIVVPGTGAIDFPAVFAALDAINYTGWLTVDLSAADVHPDEAARAALDFLRRFDK